VKPAAALTVAVRPNKNLASVGGGFRPKQSESRRGYCAEMIPAEP
jgi:hypothetical protein